MSGIELVDRMSADASLKNVPVVVISTEGSTERMADIKEKGVRAYIRKPFNPEQVRDVVYDVLGVGEGSS
jgi:two-component system chemotaxis response regulator CheY